MIETAYCVCSIEKSKNRSQLEGKFAHNMRLHEVKNADPDKRGLNEILVGDPSVSNVFAMTTEEAMTLYKEKKLKTFVEQTEDTKKMVEQATGRKVRKDAVLAVEVVLTYSSAAEDGMDIEKWKQANVEWLKSYFGEENIMSAVFHGDETQNHIHAMVQPVDRETGEPKFNAKKWLGGRTLMSKIQTSYGEAMKEFGLRRGEERSRAKHQDLQTFYKALNNVVRQKLPERQEFASDAEWKKAVDGVYKETMIRMFALEKAIQRLEAVDQTRESNHGLYRELTDAKISGYEEKILEIQKTLEDRDRKAKTIDDIQLFVKSIEEEDPARAARIREQLNEMAKKGREIGRKKEQEQSVR